MDFAFTEQQLAIKDSVAKLCAGFDDKYWLKKDKEGGFPKELHQALAKDGALLDAKEREQIDIVLAHLRELRAGYDHRAIKTGIEALARATDEFAARRMDSSIRSALTGHKIDEISV